jgi:hypothetical protein
MTEAAIDAPDVRTWSLVSGLGRVAFGMAMLTAPERALQVMGFTETGPATVAVTRLAGIRDLVLGAVTLSALSDRDRLLNATVANATADAGDAVAFALALRTRERRAGSFGLAAALPATVGGLWVTRRLS